MNWFPQVVWLVQAIVAWRLVAPVAGQDRWLGAALAFCLWSGLVSAGVYLSWRFEGENGSSVASLLLLVGTAALTRLGSGRPTTIATSPPGRGDRLILGALALAVLLATAGAVLFVLHNPHGWWDAWHQWNPRAALLARPAEPWAERSAAMQELFHADYPLLLPGVLAAGLQTLGVRSLVPPITVSCVFLIATVILVGRGLRAARGWRVGAIGTICLVSPWHFLAAGASQCGDVPLACFVAATITVLGSGPVDRHRAVLAGAMLGCAVWTKNEGQLFAAAAAAAAFPLIWVYRPRTRERMLSICMLAGAAPFVLLAALHKSAVPLANDLVDAWGSGALTHLLDPARWAQVGSAFAKLLTRWGNGLVFFLPLIVWWWRRTDRPTDPIARWWGIALALVLLGFAVVYVTTPLELAFHLRSSLDRLLAQLWPSFVIVVLRGMPNVTFGNAVVHRNGTPAG